MKKFTEEDKYKQDFPKFGNFNWKTVKLKTPKKPYYDGFKICGVVLHDGNFVTNGVLFEKGEFEIVEEDPFHNQKDTLTDLGSEYPHYCDNDEERNEVMIPHYKLNYAEAPSMDIDETIEILKNLKELGANRVYIADHPDHRGYYFYGVKLIEI